MARIAIVFVACLVLVWPASPSATTVLALRVPGRVVLAADSALTSSTGGLTSEGGGHCKIAASGRGFVMVGGFTRGGGVDVLRAVAAAVRPSTSLSDALRRVEGLYRRSIEPALHTPAAVAFYGGRPAFSPVLAIYVAGIDAGVPAVGIFSVLVADTSPFALAPHSATCPGSLCPDGRLFFGDSVAGAQIIARLSAADKPPWLVLADARAGRRLIAEQAAATPDKVRLPASVVEIDATGGRWIERGACAVRTARKD